MLVHPASYKEFATFDGVQLRGLYKDGSIRDGVMGDDKILRIDYDNLKRLFLTFSFSDIHNIEMFQCMIAAYCDLEYCGYISEIDESVIYNAIDGSKLIYNKPLEDLLMSRNDSCRLELRIFGENVECIDFKMV